MNKNGSLSVGRSVATLENADVGGVEDADGEPGNSGGVLGTAPG